MDADRTVRLDEATAQRLDDLRHDGESDAELLRRLLVGDETDGDDSTESGFYDGFGSLAGETAAIRATRRRGRAKRTERLSEEENSAGE